MRIRKDGLIYEGKVYSGQELEDAIEELGTAFPILQAHVLTEKRVLVAIDLSYVPPEIEPLVTVGRNLIEFVRPNHSVVSQCIHEQAVRYGIPISQGLLYKFCSPYAFGFSYGWDSPGTFEVIE